jgi:hypothetical protein
MVEFKLISCPKYWHFGQVEHDDIWGTFWSNLPIKKTMLSCSEKVLIFFKDDRNMFTQDIVYHIDVRMT